MKSAPIALLSVASAVAVANIYYNQPMLADIARSFGVEPHQVGWVATATQVGYALGMPLFIPLADILDRRRLVVAMFCLVAIALATTASAPSLGVVIAGSFGIGLTTIIAQILIPLASDLSPASEAGRTIGVMQSGVLLGILLARTVSGTVSRYFGWHAMFYLAAVMALLFAAILHLSLPSLPHRNNVKYLTVIRSIWTIVRETPKLRQVAFIAALFMAAFSAFWTTLIFLLEEPPFRFGSQAAGLFGLIGAVGAAVAPIAGRLSDTRSPRYVVKIAIALVGSSFCIFYLSARNLVGLVLGVIVLDAGVQAAQVANQTRVMRLRPDARNRVNTVYMVAYFAGGSVGSLAGATLWSTWGWLGVCATGLACMAIATVALVARGPEELPAV